MSTNVSFSYNMPLVSEKEVRLSTRKPLSVINGFKRPLRTQDSSKYENALNCNKDYSENYKPFPFTIFSDEEACSVKVGKSENSIWSAKKVEIPPIPMYTSREAAGFPIVGRKNKFTLEDKLEKLDPNFNCLDVSAENKSRHPKFLPVPLCETPLKDLSPETRFVREQVIAFAESFLEDEDELPFEDPDDYLSYTFPYKKDNFMHLRQLELKYAPNPKYLKFQPEITPEMRSVLVDWMVEVGDQFEYSSECIHLAILLTDRFLSVCEVSRNKLQLVGITSIFISAKFEEVHTQELQMYSNITDSAYTKKQILQMEQKIMHNLKFYVGSPTALSFLRLAYSLIEVPETILFYGQYLCELALLDTEPFLSYLPSLLGVASYCLARDILGCTTWIEELEMTGYSLEDLEPAINSLFQKVCSVKDKKLHISLKYSHIDFECVANYDLPSFLCICK